jgi:hypothetical protein
LVFGFDGRRSVPGTEARFPQKSATSWRIWGDSICRFPDHRSELGEQQPENSFALTSGSSVGCAGQHNGGLAAALQPAMLSARTGLAGDAPSPLGNHDHDLMDRVETALESVARQLAALFQSFAGLIKCDLYVF